MPTATSSNVLIGTRAVILPRGKYVRGHAVAPAAGRTDIYTVPAGRRAIITNHAAYRTSGTSLVYWHELNLSGTYYRLEDTRGTTSGTQYGSAPLFPILEPADVLTINVSSGAVGTTALWWDIWEFDSNAPLSSPRGVGTLASGDTTLYTVPSGKSALVLDGGYTGDQGSCFYVNSSGGSLNSLFHAVPSGGSAATKNRLAAAATSVTDVTRHQADMNGGNTLATGDFIVHNLSGASASSIRWTTVLELPT